ncbi:hypothetical protein [uncultured Arcobacter sp.]|uniref:hypothetical protein n=1 Tax=uncultured Arcobacter sp. TaxID=165434 RepID=UPI00262E1EC3|nr:hypothetical protein [uncultured Arcobacter sp.]
MNTNFVDIFNDVINEGKNKLLFKNEYIFKLKSRYIIDTKHASQRVIERNELTEDELVELYSKIIKGFLEKGSSYTDKDGTYLIFSKSMNQGIVVGYRKDYNKINDKRHFIVVTFLPRGRKNPKPDTELITVEAFENAWVSKEFIQYMEDISVDNTLAESVIPNGDNTFKVRDIFDEEYEFSFYYEDSKVWNFVNSFELIEID